MHYFICLFLLTMPLLASAKEYVGPAYDVNAWKSLDAFASGLSKQYGLELLNTGVGSMMDTPKVKWAISFVDHRPTTREQIRPMLIALIDQSWHKVSTDPVFLNSMVYSREKAVVPANIGFKIAFWDANVDRPLYPYLAQVRVTGEQITYFYADPKTQALEAPIVETLEEAKQFKNP